MMSHKHCLAAKKVSKWQPPKSLLSRRNSSGQSAFQRLKLSWVEKLNVHYFAIRRRQKSKLFGVTFKISSLIHSIVNQHLTIEALFVFLVYCLIWSVIQLAGGYLVFIQSSLLQSILALIHPCVDHFVSSQSSFKSCESLSEFIAQQRSGVSLTFNRRTTDFHSGRNVLNLSLLHAHRETFLYVVKLGRQIILTAAQFAWYLVLMEPLKELIHSIVNVVRRILINLALSRVIKIKCKKLRQMEITRLI